MEETGKKSKETGKEPKKTGKETEEIRGNAIKDSDE